MGGTIQMIPAKGESAKIKAALKETSYVCSEVNYPRMNSWACLVSGTKRLAG